MHTDCWSENLKGRDLKVLYGRITRWKSLKGADDGALLSVKAVFFGLRPSSIFFNKLTTFRKLELLPSSGKK
jgi:hypothetical protein